MSVGVSTDQEVMNQLKELDENAKRQVLDFIQFLKIKETKAFMDYVNSRTQEALAAKKKGEKFLSLEELQQKYA